MRIHKSLLLFLGLFFSITIYAKLPKDIVTKVLKANAAFEHYTITFERHFKYPLEKDTLSELYSSTVFKTSVDHYIGWHTMSYLRSGTARSLVAANNEGMHRVNFREKMYYVTLQTENDILLQKNLKDNIYKPFLYHKDYLEGFNEIGKDDQNYFLERIDTGKNRNQIIYIAKTKITIDKKTYIPISEEVNSYSNGNVQYSLYKLVSYSNLENNSYAPILKTADSFISIIHTYYDGDSVKRSKRDLFRKLKPGDTATFFKAEIFNAGKFDMFKLTDSILILDFFYTTCKPCIAEIPELNLVNNRFDSLGVAMYGVNTQESDWLQLPYYVKEYQVGFSLIKAKPQVAYDYGVTGYPRLFLIKNGIIVKIYYGFAKGMEKELSTLIEKLLLKD